MSMKASRRVRQAREATGPRPARAADAGHRRYSTLLFSVALAVIVFVAFYPCLNNDFNYDDERNIIENREFRGLGAANLRWMFTTFHMGHYQPLSWMSLGLDYVLWGKNPRGYHLTNLLLHIANAILVFLLARRLLQLCISKTVGRTEFEIGAFIAALLFAVHPLRVESVAWVTERRDVLSSFFLFASVLYYLRAQEEHDRRKAWLVAAVATF